MRDVFELLLVIPALALSVGYIFAANVITHSAAKSPERSSQWMMGLFITVYGLLLALLWQRFG